MKTIKTGTIGGSFAPSEVKVQQLTSGRFKGRYIIRGAGFAGRVAYSTAEVPVRMAERHAHFISWNA